MNESAEPNSEKGWLERINGLPPDENPLLRGLVPYQIFDEQDRPVGEPVWDEDIPVALLGSLKRAYKLRRISIEEN